MALKLSCPACGAEISFKSKCSVFGVCSYCSSMVVRHDLNLETLGKMAELPEDSSPLQIGTQGRYENSRFELVGRLKISWEDGNWNEWYALFDDGRDGWLAEAQGFYMVSFQVTDPQSVRCIPALQALSPGLKLPLFQGAQFQVSDIKQAVCSGSEGELPMKGPQGRKNTSVDLTGPQSQFACIDYSEDGVRLFLGKYLEFNQLKFTSLREIDGWGNTPSRNTGN